MEKENNTATNTNLLEHPPVTNFDQYLTAKEDPTWKPSRLPEMVQYADVYYNLEDREAKRSSYMIEPCPYEIPQFRGR